MGQKCFYRDKFDYRVKFKKLGFSAPLRTTSLSLSVSVWVESQKNLQLTGKISLEFDFGSSLLYCSSCLGQRNYVTGK